ncbi:MAG TPA: MFS transporter [Pyrinomonadaceae bacterium]|nr:MFS transporter [Pyrinomonadaceae bacterium]
MKRVLGNSSFRNLWLASLLSMTGSQISRVGLILYVSSTGDSVLALALLLTLELLPGALVAPLAGVVIDAYSKRLVMIVSDLLRMIFMLLIWWRPTSGMIYVMAALHSIASVFYLPAKSALLPVVVEVQDLPRANGLDQSASSLTMVAGPIIGAELLILAGLKATLIVDALSFLASALLVMRVKSGSLTRERVELSLASTLQNVKAGWSYITTHGLVLRLNVMVFVSLLCAGMWMPLAPSFVKDQLSASSRLIGWQIGMFGLGAILGGLLAPVLVRRFGKGLMVFLGLLTEGVSLTLYALVSHVVVSTLIMFALGIVVSVVVVCFYSILQTVVEEPFLGRVFSIVKQSENVAIVLAMAMAVLLHGFLNSHVILLVAGVFYVVLTVASSFSRGGRLLLGTR